jgi:hypothetical protein
MKKILFTVISGFIGLLSINAQSKGDGKKHKNDTDTLFFSIKDNKYTKSYNNNVFVRFLDARNPMHITIKNINPFLYDITMKEFQNDYLNEMKNENIQTYNYNVGSIALNFPEPSSRNFNFIEPKNEEVKQKLNSLTDSMTSKQSAINKVYYKSIYPLTDSIKKYPEKADSFQKIIDNYDVQVAQLVQSKNDFKNSLSNVKQEATGIAEKSTVFIGLQSDFIHSLNEYNKAVIRMQQLFYFYQALKIEVYSPGKPFNELYIEKKIILNKYLADFDKLNREINPYELTFHFHKILADIKKSVEEMKEIYFKFMLYKGKTDEENKLAGSMQALLDWLADEQKKFSVNDMDRIIMSIVLLYNSINEEMFTQNYTIDQIKDKTDYVQFVFEAKPKMQNQSTIIPKPISYKITMPVKHGVQLNVSSGIFFNIGLSGEKWYYRPTVNIDSFQMTKAPYKFGDLFKPSIGVLLQVYRRAPYTNRFAGCFGFSTNASDINYYLGGSLILGKSQRIVISSGLAGGQKDVFNYSFGEGRDDRIVSKTFKEKNPQILTEKKFKLGAFLSLSFNLWGKATKEFNYESSLGNSGASN